MPLILRSQEEAGALASEELRQRDFDAVTVQYFPAGSETEPFKWKDYAPRAFHRLRQSFGIDNRCGRQGVWSGVEVWS